ncbi:MAG: O-antigen ligase family protein, partial [Verrucomicrobia bacterium]|nr:O-antigen ligase family protein [Verrucomicrobiota bacterium]
MSTPSGMNRERLDQWCEWGVVGLVLALLVFAPLVLGAVRPSEFLVLQALTMLVMVLWLLRFWLNPRPHLLWPPACWGVVAFAGYALIRYWFADLEYVARQEMARVLLYTVLFLACVNNLYHQGSIRLVVYVLVLMGTGEAALAVVQFFTHPGRIWGFVRMEEALGRGSGTYFCADHLAGFLEMILPLALAYTVGSRSRALLKVLLGYACLVMAAGIVLSQSRGGWISAAFGLVLLLALLVRTSRQGLALALFVGFLFGSGFLVYSHSIVLQLRVAALRRSLARMEFDTRYGQMAAAWKMWKDHPWFGVGPAHYDVRYDNYRAENGLLQKRPRRVHNDYLNTLADWGGGGAGCLGWSAAALGLGLARHWRRLRRLNQEASSKTWNVLPFLAGAVAGVGA